MVPHSFPDGNGTNRLLSCVCGVQIMEKRSHNALCCSEHPGRVLSFLVHAVPVNTLLLLHKACFLLWLCKSSKALRRIGKLFSAEEKEPLLSFLQQVRGVLGPGQVREAGLGTWFYHHTCFFIYQEQRLLFALQLLSATPCSSYRKSCRPWGTNMPNAHRGLLEQYTDKKIQKLKKRKPF